MKKFAYYLPQFHEIPENNKWWGQGFTEWKNVKRATPLYENHVQPKHPLDNNYYCLDNLDTLIWQAKVANNYSVDGMIFYHYYFRGKKLLEKPVEMLLNKKNVPMKFFFCWANHSWYRSWDGSKELLIEQSYGEKKDWEEHFQYLLPFFKDLRYEKRDNKPLFMIFKSDFREKNEYLEYLNKRCLENGLNGLCAIEILEKPNLKSIENFSANVSNCTCFIHLREPASSLNLMRNDPKYFFRRLGNKIGKYLREYGVKYIEIVNGNELYQYLINTKINCDNLIRGVCFEWDNTPRHGYRGYVITPPSKEKFMKYMDTIKDSEYVFINAWNEWCEGMMLEPTEENGYKYLEWIKEWSEENEK